MNHNYQSVKETIITQGIDIPESYIGKALREYGLEEFPEAGLSDIGLSKLVKTVTDIYYSEIDLTLRKQKKCKLSVSKIKESKQNNSSQDLETKVKGNSNDILEVGKKIFSGFTAAALGTFFVNSSMQRRIEREYPKGIAILGGASISFMVYGQLIQHNPKLIPYVLGTQLFTNTFSLGYELARKIKNKKESKKRPIKNLTLEEKEGITKREECYAKNDCRRCDNLKCPYCRPIKEFVENKTYLYKEILLDKFLSNNKYNSLNNNHKN